MNDKIVIVTMKWGTLFGPDYVNVLYRACKSASSIPFDFVCFTDDPSGLDADIAVKTLPEIGLREEEWYQTGVWPKLALYKKNLQGLKGRCLFIDLDMIVLRDLDDFLSHPAAFISIDVGERWRPYAPRTNSEVGTGIFAFNIGQEAQILDAFLADREAAKVKFNNEQSFVEEYAKSMHFWPEGWVISFKRWLRRPLGVDLFLPPKKPPEYAKIVAFHGDPRPAQLMRQGINFWDKFPHMGHGQVGWMMDYWKRFGGTIKT